MKKKYGIIIIIFFCFILYILPYIIFLFLNPNKQILIEFLYWLPPFLIIIIIICFNIFYEKDD